MPRRAAVITRDWESKQGCLASLAPALSTESQSYTHTHQKRKKKKLLHLTGAKQGAHSAAYNYEIYEETGVLTACQRAPCATHQKTISPDWHRARDLQPLRSAVPRLLAYLRAILLTVSSQENPHTHTHTHTHTLFSESLLLETSSHPGQDIPVWIVHDTPLSKSSTGL